jgi:hypothetical protein
MSETTQRQRLFAAYVDVVLPDHSSITPGAWRERKQFIIMPPTPETYNGTRLGTPTNGAHVFSRHQTRPDHRAVWGHSLTPLSDPSGGPPLRRQVERHVTQEWLAGPVLVVELLPEELAEASTGKTPWPVLNRLKKVAMRRHSRAI